MTSISICSPTAEKSVSQFGSTPIDLQAPTPALTQRLPTPTPASADPGRPVLRRRRKLLHGALPQHARLCGAAAGGGARPAEGGGRGRVLSARGGGGVLVQTQHVPFTADAQGKQAPGGGDPAEGEGAAGRGRPLHGSQAHHQS